MTGTFLAISRVRIDGGTQSRVSLNTDVVAEYAQRVRDGEDFPPVVACLREKCIRSGSIAPRSGDAIEAKWAKDGPVPDRDLETLKTREVAA